MKKTLLTSLVSCVVMIACQSAFAQSTIIATTLSPSGHIRCSTMENLEMLKQQDPGLEARMAEMEVETQRIIQQNKKNPTTQSTLYTIPVVFHVVYNTAAQNVSDNCLNAQLAVLNADYRKLNTDWTKVTQPGWAALVADCEVNFCLATKDPAGAATTGITRTSTSVTSFSTNNAVKYTAQGGYDVWDRTKYLNIWVCNLGGGLLGYAQFPGGAAATDGVVINYAYMVGSAGCGIAPYNLGRTATHEVGHYLNLYHIWGDDGSACTGSDQVTDTPNQASENYTCWAAGTVKTDACATASPGFMWMNYMDYTDDACMYMFTAGQKARVQACLFSSRSGLNTSAATNCSAVGVNEISLNDYISIYPNPSTGEFSITTLSNINSMDVKVYNAIGEAVVAKKLNVPASGEAKINLSSNPDGIYLFQIKTSEGTITKKVVINR
ncbi:MAG: T9SS type A sorting domain-containing protein [Bacteroidetes bacterium]|nr:T9SS type A sorting domain-containing protein [Bacteroidota bacterium]